MKFTSLFSIILLAHVALIGLLLAQPGCQSQPVDPGKGPQAGQRAAPTETGERDREARDLDPAFNAGVPGGSDSVSSTRSRQLAEPRRPERSEPTEPSQPQTADRDDDGILQPVRDDRDADTASAPSRDVRYSQYEVRSGDTLTHIARRHDISLDELLQANNLNRDSTIYVGQELRIPGGAGSGSTERAAAGTGEATGEGTDYEVRSGDTLSAIAVRHGVTVSQLRSANRLSGDTIRVGQTLVIPNGNRDTSTSRTRERSSTPASAPSGNGQTHTVQSGETPTHIANRYDIPVSALMEANQISDPRRIRAGQELLIPGADGSVPESDTASEPETRDRTVASRESAPEPAPEPAIGRDVSLIDTTSQPRSMEESSSDDSLFDLESLDDEDLPYADVERVESED